MANTTSTKERGIVKWFSASRGYGFILREDGTEVFVHQTSILMEGFRKLNEGDVVEFEAEQTDKGPQAKNVLVLGGLL